MEKRGQIPQEMSSPTKKRSESDRTHNAADFFMVLRHLDFWRHGWECINDRYIEDYANTKKETTSSLKEDSIMEM